jgi:hypothetical protein
MSAARSLTFGEPFNPYKLFKGIFIPDAICQRRCLLPGSKLVYGQLCRFAGKDGKAYPSLETLGKRIGISRRQTIRHIRELEADGLIRPQRTAGKVSHYVFLWHPAFTSDKLSPQPVPDCHPTSDKLSPKESNRRESVEERKEDLDCPNRKNRDSSGRVPEGNSTGSKGKASATPRPVPKYPALRRALEAYMSGSPSRPGAPPDRIVAEVMDAAPYGATEQDVCDCLVYFFEERCLYPGAEGGPRSWEWFPVVVLDYFSKRGRREDAARARGSDFWLTDGSGRAY